jgi:hypothetical protein
MRKYVPRIHVVKEDGDHRVFFQFDETIFYAGTKYQNKEVTNIPLNDQWSAAILYKPST